MKYCIAIDQRYYGLRWVDIRHLCFQLVLANSLAHAFNIGKEVAGKKWLRGFLKRHPELSLRRPEGLSLNRTKSFNPESVASFFFDIYEKEMEKIKFNPLRVFNVDETGLTVVQHKHSRVISLKGKKQVSTITSAERGKLVTMVAGITFLASGVLLEGTEKSSLNEVSPHVTFDLQTNFPSNDDPVAASSVMSKPCN